MSQLDQLLRYDLIRHFYTELHQSDLDTLIQDKTSFNSVETFISSCCDNLISIQHNGEPHLVSRDGTFLQKYLRRAIQESFDKNNFVQFFEGICFALKASANITNTSKNITFILFSFLP